MNVQDVNLHVSQIRTQATNLIRTFAKLRELRKRHDALALGSKIVDADISGDNEGITYAQCVAVIGTTLEAFESVMDAGHATNLHTVARVD